MLGLLIAGIVGGALTLPWPVSASAANVPHPVVRSGPVSVSLCPGATLRGRATVARATYSAGQAVPIRVVVRNVGRTTCNFDGYPNGRTQSIGLCGAIPLVVRNGAGKEVYPGGLVAACPMEVSVPLDPGASLIASGTWTRVIVVGTSTAPAPSGRYHLVLGGRLVVPIVLD